MPEPWGVEMEYKIRSESLSALVTTLGGYLLSVKTNDGTEFMWQGDEKYWGARSFQIFPYVGRLTEEKYCYQGREYQMGIHGFLLGAELQLVKHEKKSVHFRFKSNSSTKRNYPFDFQYDLQYLLTGKCLTAEYSIANQGKEIMYFGMGFHPAFNIPLDNEHKYEDYILRFDRECSPVRINMSEDCFVVGGVSDYPLGKESTICLHHSLFDDDAIILTGCSSKVSLYDKEGSHRIQMTFNDFKYLMIWSMPRTEAPFLCIEPVTSLNARKDVIEDITMQESLIALEPQRCFKRSVSMTFD